MILRLVANPVTGAWWWFPLRVAQWARSPARPWALGPHGRRNEGVNRCGRPGQVPRACRALTKAGCEHQSPAWPRLQSDARVRYRCDGRLSSLRRFGASSPSVQPTTPCDVEVGGLGGGAEVGADPTDGAGNLLARQARATSSHEISKRDGSHGAPSSASITPACWLLIARP